MRYLVALAVIAGSACSLKFPDKHEGTFACSQDSDCTSPFICKGGICVDLNGAPRCNPPTVTGSSTPAVAQYVGFGYTLSGTAVSDDPTCPLGTDTAWLVCDAPAGSMYVATDGTNCTHLADGDTASFTPDVHGTYNLTLRATAGDATGKGIVPLEALADALFVEMSYVDSRTLQALVHEQISAGCYDFDQATCATHPECTFDTTYGTCWTNCAGLDQTICQNHFGQCEYNASGPSCDSNLNQQAACLVRNTHDTCVAIPRCAFADIGLCYPDCSAFTVETDCTSVNCIWDAVSSTCGGGQDLTTGGFNETTIAQLYTDGSDAVPLFYGGSAQYRYDPNGIFPDVELGNGVSSATFGLAYDPVTRIAILPHLYIYETPPVNGDLQCRAAMNLVVWRQGDTFGRPPPGGVQALLQVNPNNTSDTGATTVNHSVGYPRLITRDNGTVRFVYGDAINTIDITTRDQACTLSDGSSNVATAYALSPILTSQLQGPLVTRTPMPLFIGETGAVQSGATFPLTSKHLTASSQPCRNDYDCGVDLTTSAQLTCTAGTCSAAFNVEGYLPQLMAKGDALAYSHVSCGSAYGAACSDGEYDLMLAKVVTNSGASIATDFQLHNMTLVSAEPGVAELDAFIPGDIFGDLTDVYYLVRSDKTVTVSVSDSGTVSTTTQSLPVFSLHARQLNWNNSTGWTVTPPATSTGTLVLDGTITTQDISSTPLSCALDGVADRIVLTTAIIHNPLEFAFSPDGRYLAYADVTVATACATAIFTSGGQLAASEVTGSSVKVIDLTSLSPAPQDLFPASCVTQFNLQNDAQLMPTWVAGGAQIVFNSRAGSSKDFVNNRFFRMNTVDLGASDCRIVELTPRAAAARSLTAISSTLTPQGLTLVDSRTGQFACISCAGAGPEGATMFAVVAIAALWRATRRRRTA